DRMKTRHRGGVVNDSEKSFGKTDPLAQPIESDLFKLCCRGRGFPEHSVHVHGSAEQFAQNSRTGTRHGEIRVESRMIPLREAGYDQLAEIAQDRVHRLALGRTCGWQLLRDVPGSNIRQDGQIANIAKVI